MQFAPFTHGAPVLLRICTPPVRHITLSKKYCLDFVSAVSWARLRECFGGCLLSAVLQQVYWFTRSTMCADATAANSTIITPKEIEQHKEKSYSEETET